MFELLDGPRFFELLEGPRFFKLINASRIFGVLVGTRFLELFWKGKTSVLQLKKYGTSIVYAVNKISFKCKVSETCSG